MSSRALSLATVMLLIGCAAAVPARAQQNLEAGKSPSQIFEGACTACHKGPRGLLKTVPAGSLPGFLRQHYTTSSDMASLLSSFLISNGAADTRYLAGQPKPGKGAAADAKPSAPPEQVDRQGRRLRIAAPSQEGARPDASPQQAVKPDTDGLSPQAEPGRRGRNAMRPARPGEPPDAERGPDGRNLNAKQRLSKRGKPAEELPKTDAVREEPAKVEPVKDDKPNSEAAKEEGSTGPEGGKPPTEGKSEAVKIDVPKETGSGETPALRADPVPPVTPAPLAAAPASSAAVSVGAPEPAAAPSPAAAAPAPSAPPAVTASAPPEAPVTPSGPPVPPISQ
jgi:hypothetical protein